MSYRDGRQHPAAAALAARRMAGRPARGPRETAVGAECHDFAPDPARAVR